MGFISSFSKLRGEAIKSSEAYVKKGPHWDSTNYVRGAAWDVAKASASASASLAWEGAAAGLKYGFRSGKASARASGSIYSSANDLSKLAVRASIPQMAVVGGAGLATYGILADRPVQTAQSIGGAGLGMYDEMKSHMRMSRGSNSQRSFQHSTQGLVFGLNNRRTG